MSSGISLANKCQLLFGAAIVLIIATALAIPWVRMGAVLNESMLETSRQIANLWPNLPTSRGGLAHFKDEGESDPSPGAIVATLRPEVFADFRPLNNFAGSAVRRLKADPQRQEHSERVWESGTRVQRYAQAVRSEIGVLDAVILVEHRSTRTAAILLVNRTYLLTAGALAGLLAVGVFYLITTRLILSPVRELRETAERVGEGDLRKRAQIETGDEFEELASAFNEMLGKLEEGQDRLREVNHSLDLRLNELAQANVALHEANVLKGEFVANVSHELRTPLNSIIGFAELLIEIAIKDHDRGGALDETQFEKRQKYLGNIVVAGRRLLEMINELLMMAKLEAGRTELSVEPMVVVEACEGLLALIRPQSDEKSIELKLEMIGADASEMVVETDPRKLQQIVFNFLSNAVKFTPEKGRVTLRVEKNVGGDAQERLRFSVLDTGPGILKEDQKRIFEKFTQIESGPTKRHAGTGLGLAICKQLADIIQGEIQVESESGQGSMFSLLVPARIQRPERTPAAAEAEGETQPQPDGSQVSTTA